MRRIDGLTSALAVAAIANAAAVGAQTAPPVVTVSGTSAVTLPQRSGEMTPQTIVLRPMSPVEAKANAIWSLRAGLNVAALQCQFSPYLATVRSYNDMLKHHSSELAAAQATMIAHFKRYDGKQALNSFDQYSTRIYNSYSTLDAQFTFCTAASTVGRQALLLSKGSFGSYALDATPALRTALVPVPRAALTLLDSVVPAIE